jgi:hypothetical protein
VGSREDVLRTLAGEGQVERVWAEVEVAGPLELTMVTELHLVEHAIALPRGEDASAGEVGHVHLSFSTILVAQPNSITRQRPDSDWSYHTDSVPIPAAGSTCSHNVPVQRRAA